MSETKRQRAANYRKPPVHTRPLQEGPLRQSARPPRKKPRGSVGRRAQRESDRHRERRQVTKRMAVIAQLVNKSASAELRVTNMLIDMLREVERRAEPAAAE